MTIVALFVVVAHGQNGAPGLGAPPNPCAIYNFNLLTVGNQVTVSGMIQFLFRPQLVGCHSDWSVDFQCNNKAKVSFWNAEKRLKGTGASIRFNLETKTWTLEEQKVTIVKCV